MVNSDALGRGNIARLLLSGLNDDLTVTPYAHGFLASLPFYFYDDDRVKLFIEPYESGIKVGDRGLTSMRLTMADVNFSSRRIEEALRQSVGGSLFHVDIDDGEVSGFGAVDGLPDLVFAVASAVLRVDQLRWLAAERRPVAFRDRVVDELVQVVGQKDRVTPHAMLALKSGRRKQVTASVASARSTDDQGVPDQGVPLYVQALSGQDSDARESAVARCFHLFSLADAPRDRLVAIVSGTRQDWPDSLVSEISQVSTVAFFEERGSVANTVESKLASTSG